MRNFHITDIPVPHFDGIFSDSSFTKDLPDLIANMKNQDSWLQGELNSIVLLQSTEKQVMLTTMHEGTEIKFFPLNDSIKFEVIEGKIRILIHQEAVTLRKGQVLTCPTDTTLILTTKEKTVLLLTISKVHIRQPVN